MKPHYLPFVVVLLIFPSFVIASLNLQIAVTDYAGINRLQDPVTSGVPLPNDSAIISASQLRITDSMNNPVPAQFTVLSRWNGIPTDLSKPIKWVLLDFQADVPMNGTSIYYLKDNGEYNFASSLSVQDLSDMIIVSTGKAKFQISKNYFNLFDYVWVDKDSGGQLDDAIISSAGKGGLVLTDENGTKYYTNLEAPEQVKVEESGPMRTVVLIRGVFKAQDGTYFAPSIHNPPGYPRFNQPYQHSYFYYNVRIHFFDNKDYAKVVLTIENNGAQAGTDTDWTWSPRQEVYIHSLDLVIPYNLSQNITSKDGVTSRAASETVSLFQGWAENAANLPFTLENTFAKGPSYQLKRGSSIVANGSTNPGWMDISGNSQVVALAMKDFWQNFYKKITVNDSVIRIGFWPEGGYYPFNQGMQFSNYSRPVYLFGPGRHKTHEMLIGFNSSTQGYAQVLSKSLESPLMAFAPPNWYADTKALGLIAPAGLSSTDAAVNESFQRYDKKQEAMVIASDSENGNTMLTTRTDSNTYPYLRKWRFWGWMNFGDYLWKGTVYTGGHEDFPYAILLNYLRTGQRAFFDTGEEMIMHRYDIDQYHGDRTDTNNNHKWHNYFQRFEQELHSDCTGGAAFPTNPYCEGDEASLPDYTWNNGLLLDYVLTGDRKALEASDEDVKGVLNYFGPAGLEPLASPQCSQGGLLSYIRSISVLVDAYRINGNRTLLDLATKIAKNVILYREQQVGGSGIMGNGKDEGATVNYCLKGIASCNLTGCNQCSNVEYEQYMSTVYEPLVNLQFETQDPQLKDLVIRMATFVRDRALFGGTLVDSTHYVKSQVSDCWLAEDPDGSIRKVAGIPLNNIYFSDLLAYAFQLTGDYRFLSKARTAFKDLNLYGLGGTSGNSSINPASRYLITYGSGDTISTKEQAQMARLGQVYLYTEYTQGGIIPLSITNSVLPQALINVSYSQIVSALGGQSPYVWSLLSGSLPPTLSLSGTGLISGFPTQVGNFSFVVKVLDSASNSTTKSFSIKVNANNNHRADSNHDGCIELSELLSFVSRWQVSSRDVSISEIIDAVKLWKVGCP